MRLDKKNIFYFLHFKISQEIQLRINVEATRTLCEEALL